MRQHSPSFLVWCVVPWLLTIACTAGSTAATNTSADRAVVIVTVEPSNTHPISPYIYGINFGAQIVDASGLTLDRHGGNRWTAYNWVTNASNAGSDYQYQNDNFLSSDRTPGSAVSALIAADQKIGVPSLVTVQMQGLVAGDENGPVSVVNPPDRTRFRRVVYEKRTVSSQPFTVTPSAAAENVYMDEFLWALDRRFSGQGIFGANPSTQHVFISLDNEPELWKSTHLEIQGRMGITADSYITKTISLATALKRQFPDLVIFGPVHYGFVGIYNWNGELSATPAGSNWFADKYLAAMRVAGTAFGRPLVDVYDFHWYPEATDHAGTRVTNLMGAALTADQVQAIVQSPRSLWDKT